MQATLDSPPLRPSRWAVLSLAGWALALGAYASDKKMEPPAKPATKPDIEATTASNPKDVGDKVRDALGTSILPNKKLVVSVNSGKAGSAPAVDANPTPAAAMAPAVSAANRRINQARAAAISGHMAATPAAAMAAKATEAHSGEAHWAYEGENGPQAWGNLKPEFNLCATGRRQSPISIEDGATLQGPAEPILFNYLPSNGTVVNNGHTIQVDVVGDNAITVRGSSYRLLQFHFHTPSEEQVNFKRYPMVAHLVHKNAEGQLAVVAVLLDNGSANALIEKVWTYMPLDAGDRVRMPADLLNVGELLPKDQRYYQFMGSLTTPPCSEGVLWMVLKTPMSLSKAQLRLFTQLYPNNARPVQPVNARPVRDAQ
ncbi:MAG: carbonate dehydratase [Burkholderiales bacterium PBB3]|nr:MAG: carbonate dehydratase [Burkholderiales bacterium PBB3]